MNAIDIIGAILCISGIVVAILWTILNIKEICPKIIEQNKTGRNKINKAILIGKNKIGKGLIIVKSVFYVSGTYL
jgi:hypothetical protein